MSAFTVLDRSTPRDVLARHGGGKAAQLAAMEALGIPVPAWFCIPSDVMEAAVFDAPLSSGAGGPGEDGTVCPPGSVPEDVAALVRRELDARGMAGTSLAVRSSGLEEDGVERSFAGQFESVLHCRGEEAVLAAIARCWASAFSDRIHAYRTTLGGDTAGAGTDGTEPGERRGAAPAGAPRMGVVIQEMVEAEVAGVVFSRNPSRALDRDTVLVESLWGLGDGLVSGDLPGDRHTFSRATGEVTTEVVEKLRARVRAPGGGTRDVPVCEGCRQRSSLTTEQVEEVARVALRLEEALGSPQDCEWAYGKGRLFLLQTRPITTLPPDAVFDADIVGQEPVIWDNSNIIESYAGVTTPLTFSHISRSYREVYRVTCRVGGVPESVIAEHEPLFRNMLGLIRGRVYYNLGNWYRLLSLFPLLGRSGRFMETMMGVRNSLPEELAERVDPTATAPRYGLLRRLRLVGRLLGTLVAGARGRAAFLRRMDEVCEPLEAGDLGDGSLAEQVAAHRMLEERVLKHWHAPIDNDTRCMISFGLLGVLTRRWIGGSEEEAAALQNDLLCGQGDLTSAEPARILMEIARAVDAGDGDIRERILNGEPEVVWEELATRAPELRTRFDDHVRRFGFRCVDELKLETKDFHDRPWLLVATVRSYLRHGLPGAEEQAAREREIRESAEARLAGCLGPIQRRTYGLVLGWTRRAVADRERLRFERTRAFGLIRRIFRGMGRNLAALGRIDDADDVFYLTVEELVAFVEGRAVGVDLRSLVEARKAEYEEYRRTPPPPDRLVTRGAAGAALPYPGILAQLDPTLAEAGEGDEDPSLLRGTPCCAGVVEAPVRVAHRFEDCAGLEGEILVTQRTDPGWIPVFPALAGLLVERGGLLSHSAVVAREMGVPTIVGLRGRPLERLRTGDRVRMDGARGIVEILP